MKCLNCGKEFIRKTGKNYKYCSSKCYWQYHLKDILRGGKNDRKRI